MAKKDITLTHDRLKEVIHYSPITGIFYWRISSKGTKQYDTVGSVHSAGYLEAQIDKNRVYLHRVAIFYCTGKWPEYEVDHINHVPHDNRWLNLRCTDHVGNTKNCSISKNNVSGICGVYWSNQINKWIANIHVNHKTFYLGCSADKETATQLRKDAEVRCGFHKNHGS